MRYNNIVCGSFLSRPNRFIAHVMINGQKEICHVKNTGRCKELLVPGCCVYCQKFDDPRRKTQYDLIAVRKNGRLINIDSQAPNKAAGEWLVAGGLGALDGLRPEVTFGNSRFDFGFLRNGQQCYLEVKGVTLEHDRVCAFPDAPTQRGAKHLSELAQAAKEGCGAWVLFVIQMKGVSWLHPNDATDPNFGKALREAAEAGVQILAMDCTVTEDSMVLHEPVEVRL